MISSNIDNQQRYGLTKQELDKEYIQYKKDLKFTEMQIRKSNEIVYIKQNKTLIETIRSLFNFTTK